MKKTALLTVITTVILTAVCGCLYLTPAEESVPLDITLAELEKKMQKASDPDGVFLKAKSYVQKQIVTRGSQKYMVLVQYLAPDKYRIETRIDNKSAASVILNGTVAWTVNYADKKVTPMSGEEVTRLQTLYDLGDPNTSLSALFAGIALTQCRMEGEEYYKLNCTPKVKNTPPLVIYVGKNSFLIREIRIPSPMDYRAVIKRYGMYEGVLIPEDTEIIQNGKKSSSVIFENKLNVPLENSLFLPPVFN